MKNKKLVRITTVPESMRTLLKGQLRFMRNYYDVIAVSSNGECFNDMLQEQGVRGFCINMTRQITPLVDLKALFQLILLLWKERPDIVHTHTPKAGLLGMIAAKIVGVPIRLHTIAGLPLLETTGYKRKLLNYMEKLTNACATRVYPNSFAMKEIIIQQHLCAPRKLKVIANGSSNGIDTLFFSTKNILQSREEIRLDLGFKQQDTVFVFIGRIVKDKGVNELIDAFKEVMSRSVKLLIVGGFEKERNPILPENEKFIINNSCIKFVGWQSDVRPFLYASDVLVFPSYREGFPNVVMQAGAMGLASIVSDINGCNEIIENEKNGLIIPPKNHDALAEAMKRMIDDVELRMIMSANARKMIRARYEQKMIWDELLKEYRSLESNV
ncbi:glycosyltransferase family 4 protein [Butyricimonas virosa]|jgi:glycosyltransferase involved in cell wall biosynthesis|uniref:Glycosyltransferase family 1 protein n=1 Tax=Butyricimonas virosa TaxID=544645 RepID=A0A415QF68_9BACT|nr:glycosyltransferase family 4 protein [Butyricimonas virosa]RHM41503.1 glycosyltransferase family 1 protein [Butyricimonas virosa]